MKRREEPGQMDKRGHWAVQYVQFWKTVQLEGPLGARDLECQAGLGVPDTATPDLAMCPSLLPALEGGGEKEDVWWRRE